MVNCSIIGFDGRISYYILWLQNLWQECWLAGDQIPVNFVIETWPEICALLISG